MGQGISASEDQVEEALDQIHAALNNLRDLDLTRLPDQAVLSLTQQTQYAACRLFAGLVREINEVDVRGLAKVNGASSTAMLLRERLKMSSGQANNLVRIGKATRCTLQPSGAITPPDLPAVADLLDTGELTEESTGIIARFMKSIPADVDADTRRLAEEALVDQAAMCDPHQVRDAAREIAVRIDPDGKLAKDATNRMRFEIGNRSVDGLTKVRGALDDLTIERLKKALMGLSAPKPGPCGERDQRSAGERQAHGLSELLDRFLKTGKAPLHGGVRPQVVVVGSSSDFLGGLPDTDIQHLIDRLAAEAADRAGNAEAQASTDNGDSTDEGDGDTESNCGDGENGSGTGNYGDDSPDVKSRSHGRPENSSGGGPLGPEPGATGVGVCPYQPEGGEKSARGWKKPGPGRPRVAPANRLSPLSDLALGSATPRAGYGGAVPIGTLRMLACDADILPITLGGAGEILDVGRSVRSFPPHLRKAAAARDQGCSFPGCAVPADWTDGHHVIPWSEGGNTSLDNCALLCGFHHTVIHQGDWTMYLADDGHPEFIPPTWIDLQQRPIRNTVHRPHLGRTRAGCPQPVPFSQARTASTLR